MLHKAITIIISIQNYGLRTEAVLELMRRASVPCSKEVKALIDGAMEKTSSRSSEITEQVRPYANSCAAIVCLSWGR